MFRVFISLAPNPAAPDQSSSGTFVQSDESIGTGSQSGDKHILAESKRRNRLWPVTRNSLQKQVGCFNHRVVALVADKLERQWLLEVCFGVED